MPSVCLSMYRGYVSGWSLVAVPVQPFKKLRGISLGGGVSGSTCLRVLSIDFISSFPFLSFFLSLVSNYPSILGLEMIFFSPFLFHK